MYIKPYLRSSTLHSALSTHPRTSNVPAPLYCEPLDPKFQTTNRRHLAREINWSAFDARPRKKNREAVDQACQGKEEKRIKESCDGTNWRYSYVPALISRLVSCALQKRQGRSGFPSRRGRPRGDKTSWTGGASGRTKEQLGDQKSVGGVLATCWFPQTLAFFSVPPGEPRTPPHPPSATIISLSSAYWENTPPPQKLPLPHLDPPLAGVVQ